MWGDWLQDSSGEKLSSLFDSLGLLVLNEGSRPTFVGKESSSIVNLMEVSESIGKRASGCWVHDEVENLLNHQYITFEQRGPGSRTPNQTQRLETERLKPWPWHGSRPTARGGLATQRSSRCPLTRLNGWKRWRTLSPWLVNLLLSVLLRPLNGLQTQKMCKDQARKSKK